MPLAHQPDDPVSKLSQALDAIGCDKKADVAELLWGPKPTATVATTA